MVTGLEKFRKCIVVHMIMVKMAGSLFLKRSRLVKMKATDAVGDGPSTSAGTTSAAPDHALPALFAEMQGQLVSKKEGKDIHPALANLLTPVMRSEPDGDKMKELVQGYPRPENMPNLTVPELNDNLQDQGS